jgi:hypothetical protein
MVELLWVTDPAEAQAEMARPLQLWERWSGRQGAACPFGICLRPSHPSVQGLPFDSWPYRPAYLPADLCLYIAAPTSPQMPLIFYFPLHRRPNQQMAQYMEHPIGLRRISRVLVCGPFASALDFAGLPGNIAFHTEAKYLIEIGFDREQAGRFADLRPTLPLILRW